VALRLLLSLSHDQLTSLEFTELRRERACCSKTVYWPDIYSFVHDCVSRSGPRVKASALPCIHTITMKNVHSLTFDVSSEDENEESTISKTCCILRSKNTLLSVTMTDFKEYLCLIRVALLSALTKDVLSSLRTRTTFFSRKNRNTFIDENMLI